MADVLDISASPRLPLSDALDPPEGAGRALIIEGGQAVARRPMLWPVEDAQIQLAHEAVAQAVEVELHVVRDVVVGGAGAHARKDGRYLHTPAAMPGYVRHWMETGIDPAYWEFGPAPERLELDAAFSLLHFNLVYGHWLTEMFPKLAVIDRLMAEGVRAPVLLPATAPAYVRATIEDVLPGLEIVTYQPHDQEVFVGRLLLPGMMQAFYTFHPAFNDWAASLVRERTTAAPTPPAIFLSRKNLPDPSAFRRMENVAEVERIAADFGLAIVHPEHLPWREQVRLFGGASLIVGEYGSGLHNALFAPPGARVVGLNWITDIQSRIANSRAQDVGYILDPDGRPRTYSLERTMNGFRIDPGELRARLASLVGAPPARWSLARLFGR